ncbi:hypothetical protein VCHA37P200_130042 [Vibrio chagasii]|nr:hypothetical protein VCHA35O142_110029 [Vibrio chagasii]CAH6810911.1 hypothetical protein VCHA34P129_130042 [Vibrio chagasii]CAH6829051.1 hypothetical protein VCHA36P164_170042 [Vibrio chagasii]CAH6887298.1 hypothetical protein VCHA36P166_270042 [Vibrio chagasii]CAH6894607.1 hypothetical protein VCHA34P112_320012 [Vibrio chagasii]
MIIYSFSLPLKDSYLFEGDHQTKFWLFAYILVLYSWGEWIFIPHWE